MRIVSIATAIGIAVSLGGTPLAAQSFSYGVGGGLTIPTGDFSDGFNTGWNLLAVLGYGRNAGLGFRGDFYYGQNGIKDPFDGHAKLAGGLANVVYTFPGGRSTRPYVIGGVGVFNAKVNVSAGGLSGSDSETKFAFGLGGGASFRAGRDSRVFAESRFIVVNTSDGSTNFIPLTVGISFGTK
ncbi:MAG TPA: outer membrane beta-barrel protein [Gemmatimonadales bacterium]|jgi:opacity protein-like surface antigen